MSLKSLAQRATSLSVLMEGRDKISTEEVIKKYPEGITINEVDMVNGDKGEYPVFTIQEDNSLYYCGGLVLKKVVDEWLGEYETLDRVNEALKEETITVILSQTRTKGGNNLTKVEIC